MVNLLNTDITKTVPRSLLLKSKKRAVHDANRDSPFLYPKTIMIETASKASHLECRV